MSTPDPSETSTPCLVEVTPGVAVLFGDEPVAGLDVEPFQLLGDDVTRGLTDTLAQAVGLANVVAPGIEGVSHAQGLVRLAPGTLEAMKTAKPLTSDGWNLGTLAKNGQITHQVRWLPATGAQASTVAASMGPALVLVALQMQLASISRRLDENISLTRDVLETIHQDQWMTLQGLRDTTVHAVREAQAVGFVNGHIFATISAREADLRKQQHLFQALVTAHLRELDTAAKGRREYLLKNAHQIVADAQGLMMAEASWFRYQALRAAHIAHDVEHADENQKLLEQVVDDADRGHREAMDQLGRLVDDLHAQAHLALELQSSGPLSRMGKGKSVATVVAAVDELASQAADMRGVRAFDATPPTPQVTAFEEGVPDELPKLLRWVLPSHESLLALADVNLDRKVLNNAYLVITDQNLRLSSQKALKGEGEVESTIPLTDIRYVRLRERPKQGPALDVITKDEDIHLTFDAWAATGDGLARAQRIANILTAVMHLPDEERTADPLVEALVSPHAHRELPAGGAA